MGEGDFFMRVWWFSTKGLPNQEMMQVCFPHYFSYVLLFFSASFPNKQRGKDEYAFRWQLLFFAVVFFLKGLGHTARSIDCLHGAIGNLSEDSAPVGVLQSQWSRGTSEISAEKTLGWFKSEKGLPPFWKIRKLKKTPWRWLEGAKMCQVPFFFSGFFQGKFQGFNSTRHWWFASFSWVIWGGFGWMPFSWRLTWRKFVRPGGVTGRLA